LSCRICSFIAWRQEGTKLVKTLISGLIRSICIFPGAIAITGGRVARGVFVPLEGHGHQVIMLMNHSFSFFFFAVPEF
jgi:hypothetical protein